MKKFFMALILMMAIVTSINGLTYNVVDSGNPKCYDNTVEIDCGNAEFPNQDGDYQGPEFKYKNNGDETITDETTGLMWQKGYISAITYAEAVANASLQTTGDHKDWRLPSTKELFSLMNFKGDSNEKIAYVDRDYFSFEWGDESAPIERDIDVQFWSTAKYVGPGFAGNECNMGVNLGDGHIKCYPDANKKFVRYVRGNTDYGKNKFKDNGDETVSDEATGLMWEKSDGGKTYLWQDGLKYCDALSLGGHSDWRLPNIKELHSLLDYTKSPEATTTANKGPCIDTSVFEITNKENGYFMSSTTLLQSTTDTEYAYIAFGKAEGFIQNPQTQAYSVVTVHGAGAQRADPKTGSASDFPHGRGPQLDVVNILNNVRCVRTQTTQESSNAIYLLVSSLILFPLIIFL